MKKLLLGVVIAAIVVYVWGFLVWGLGPYRTAIWKAPRDDAVTGRMLREHFPDDGTYYVPSFTHDDKATEELFQRGPVAMVHMLAVKGRPAFDPSIMLQGFALNLAGILLIASLLRQVAGALPKYSDRVKFTTIAGVAATLLIDGGDIVWWQIPLTWKLYQAGYDLSFWIITGLILARFIDSEPAPAGKPQTP